MPRHSSIKNNPDSTYIKDTHSQDSDRELSLEELLSSLDNEDDTAQTTTSSDSSRASVKSFDHPAHDECETSPPCSTTQKSTPLLISNYYQPPQAAAKDSGQKPLSHNADKFEVIEHPSKGLREVKEEPASLTASMANILYKPFQLLSTSTMFSWSYDPFGSRLNTNTKR